VAAEIRVYSDKTTRASKLAAIARAIKLLQDADEYVIENAIAPERAIMRQIIEQWRRIVSNVGGELGRAETNEPVTNPYIIANPVIGGLFVGREDILRQLEEKWSRQGQKPSVVLYGHRRMGKSSILRNLKVRLGAQTTLVDFNMQRIGLVTNTGELLFDLALALYDAFPNSAGLLAEPKEESFRAHNPYRAFDRYLKQLDQVRTGQTFITTIDEFELIEKAIAEHRLDPQLLDFWRGLIQTYPWFVMVFAGLHTLEEMRHDYWNPLFGSVTAIEVSFLSPEATRRLITQPSPEFDIDYDPAAVEHIIGLTNGQPYLVQLIGHNLVTRFNRQVFEEGKQRLRRFALEDVDAVINAPEVFRDGNAYFHGVWVQAEDSPDCQPLILESICNTVPGKSLAKIIRETGLSSDKVRAALDTLRRHDVIVEREGKYAFAVELMRRWVAQRKVSHDTQR
jgi:hypothetical protein